MARLGRFNRSGQALQTPIRVSLCGIEFWNNAMMNTLLAFSDYDLDRELKKPNALPLYPSRGTSDADGVEILWAPFDFVNRNARILIVGVTPGPNQARRSYKAVRVAVAKGDDPQADLERIKAESSFRGDIIEPNLKSLLEHSGLAERAGIADIDYLWTKEASKVHFTSTIRYPKCSTTKSILSSIRNSGSTWKPILPRNSRAYQPMPILWRLVEKAPRSSAMQPKQRGSILDGLWHSLIRQAVRPAQCAIFYRNRRRKASGPAAACFVIAPASPRDGIYPTDFRSTTSFTEEAASGRRVRAAGVRRHLPSAHRPPRRGRLLALVLVIAGATVLV